MTSKGIGRLAAGSALILISLAATPGYADNSPTPSQVPSDGGLVKSGDVILWQVNKPIDLEQKVWAKNAPKADADGKTDKVCFPESSLFQVSSVVAGSTPAADQGQKATVSNTQIVSGYFPSKPGWKSLHFFHKWALGYAPDTTPGASPCGPDYPLASYATTYVFTADDLKRNDLVRGGFTWGGLVIPYKFYFTDHSFKSNASVVAFAGYEGWFPGLSLSAVMALGPGISSSSSNPAAASSTPPAATTPAPAGSATFATYTVAVGLIAAFGDSKTVKAGLLLGRDYQGKGSGFQYENKTWLALSIGAGF